MKLMGIDWGKSRIGISVSNSSWSIVSPVLTLKNRSNIIKKITELKKQYNIKRFVIGLPLSISEGNIKKQWGGFSFFEKLKSNTKCPVSWSDERFSTEESFEKLSEIELKHSFKRKKVDQVAAVIILERYIAKKKKNKNAVLAVTGNIGTGKSFVTQKFKNLFDAKIIDADNIAKKISQIGKIGYKKIKKEFGETYFKKNGELNRKKLGERVFKDDEIRKKLNNLLHPVIIENIKEKISNLKNKFIVLEIPLLIEEKLYYLYDYSLLTKASKDVIIERVKKTRDHFDSNYIQKIMNKQAKSKEIENLFDYIINTANGWDSYKKNVKRIGKKILKYQEKLNRR